MDAEYWTCCAGRREKLRNSRGESWGPGLPCCTTGCANTAWVLPEEKQEWRVTRTESEPLGIGVFFLDFREKALLWMKGRKAGYFCFRPTDLFLYWSLSASMGGCLPPGKNVRWKIDAAVCLINYEKSLWFFMHLRRDGVFSYALDAAPADVLISEAPFYSVCWNEKIKT